MVHDLRTLKVLNDQEVRRTAGKPQAAIRPPEAINRAIQNRPWTRSEYGGPTPQETFAKSNRGESRCIVHGIIVV